MISRGRQHHSDSSHPQLGDKPRGAVQPTFRLTKDPCWQSTAPQEMAQGSYLRHK